MYHSSKWESKSYRIAKKKLQWAHSLKGRGSVELLFCVNMHHSSAGSSSTAVSHNSVS